MHDEARHDAQITDCRDVHGDVWALVQIGFVGSESITQVEQFWRQIVLPFFGITDLEAITPEFGPPSPAATCEADRNGPADTPVDTPAPSQDASGAVAGGPEQSGASSRDKNTAPSTVVSSDGAQNVTTMSATEATPHSSVQEAGGSPPAAPAGANNPSASPSTEGDAGQYGAVQMEVDNVESMRGGSGGGSGGEPDSDDRDMTPEVPLPGQGPEAAGSLDEGGEDDEDEDGDGADDDEEEDEGADPEASDASKLEESDADDLEESGGISGAKGDKGDGVDDEEDDEDDPASHGLISSPSKLPIDFNHPAKV
jgi:hypothetical protein